MSLKHKIQRLERVTRPRALDETTIVMNVIDNEGNHLGPIKLLYYGPDPQRLKKRYNPEDPEWPFVLEACGEISDEEINQIREKTLDQRKLEPSQG